MVLAMSPHMTHTIPSAYSARTRVLWSLGGHSTHVMPFLPEPLGHLPHMTEE